MKISVVIPTFRRPDLLERCLQAIAQQTLSPDHFEVVVADDADSLSTQEEIEKISASYPVSISYVGVRSTHGPAAARNRGWHFAQGEIIAFTDDDTIPEPQWLEKGLAAFECDPKLAAAWGRVVMPLPNDPTDYEKDAAKLGESVFVTANCFCRKHVLIKVGGFDERFKAAWREDSDLYFRLLDFSDEAGLKLIALPEAAVVHPIRPASWGVCLQQQKKSQFNALLYKKHPERYRLSIQRTPPWRFYGIVLSLLFSLVCFALGNAKLGFAFSGVWLALTAAFCAIRLKGTSREWAHRFEMAVTSVLIPFMSVYWRLYGAFRFRVFFL